MANKITTILDLDDRGFRKSIGNIRKDIADADGASNKFKAGWAGAMSSLQANAGVAAVAAGTAIVAFGAKAVEAASRVAESTNAVGKSFGEAADDVLEIGENSAKSFGLSQAAFNEAAVSFASFAKTIAGPGGDVAKSIEDLTTRAADFASVMNIDVAEASTVFRSGLSGETEPLKKFGIDLSAAAVEAYALGNGLVKSRSDMTEAIKVQARYGLLMEKTTQFAGDFKDTSGGLANSSRILSATMEDLSAKFGEQLTPSIAVAVGWAIKFLDVVEAISNVPSAEIPGFPIDLEESNRGFKAYQELLEAASAGNEEAAKAVRDGKNSLEEAGLSGAVQASAFEARMRTMQGAARDFGTQLEDNAGAYVGFAQGMIRESKRVAEAQQFATDAMNEWHDATLEAIDASLGYRNQQARTAETIRAASLVTDDLSTSTDEAAQAARDAEGAALDQAAAAVALAEQQNAVNGVTLTAEEKTKIYKEELEKIAGFLTGPAREAIDAYIAQLGSIPGTINTNISLNRRGDIIGGSINGRRAAGGPVSSGGLYEVGENGNPELFQQGGRSFLIPGNNGQVIPVRGGAGEVGVVVYLTVNAGLGTNGAQVGRQIVDVLEAHYRNGGRPPRSG